MAFSTRISEEDLTVRGMTSSSDTEMYDSDFTITTTRLDGTSPYVSPAVAIRESYEHRMLMEEYDRINGVLGGVVGVHPVDEDDEVPPWESEIKVEQIVDEYGNMRYRESRFTVDDLNLKLFEENE